MPNGRYKSDTELDLLNKVKVLEERLSKLERTPQLISSSITDGDLTINNGANIIVNGGAVNILNEANASEVILSDGFITMISEDTSGDAHNGSISALVLAENNNPALSGRMAMYFVPPYSNSVGDPNNNLMYLEGQTPNSPGSFLIRGNATGGSGTISASIMDVHGDNDIVLRALNGNGFLTATGALVISADTSLANLDGNQVTITSDADQCFIDHTTTALAANCRIETTGQILRSTSTARNKVDIDDLDVDTEAVLRLRPRTWRDKKEAQDDPQSRFYVGMVAEEVAEELPGFVEYNEQGLPEAIAYDRLAVALLAVVQEQAAQIRELANGQNLPKRPRTGREVGPQPAHGLKVPRPERIEIKEVPIPPVQPVRRRNDRS